MSVLVFDVGSSGLKAAAFSDEGVLLAEADAGYGTIGPHRQLASDWWAAAITAAARLPRTGIAAIALSGSMENLVLVDAEGSPVDPAILYSDPLGATALAAATDALSAIDAKTRLGNPPEPLMTAFKYRALADADPAFAAGATTILPGAKDFLGLVLTGRRATDPTTASTSGLMHLRRRAWDEDIVRTLGIRETLLPELLPADAALGLLLPGPARALGLEPGIPVVNGAGDGGTTTVGSGADRAGDVSLYLGTTGWVARLVDLDAAPAPRGPYRLAHPLGPAIIEISPILSAGAAAQWARTVLGLGHEAADALALGADAEPAEALFLPYLAGERFPFLDLDLRAGFLGLSASTGPGALYRAVLEGVAFAIAANLKAMPGAVERVTLCGGGAQSPLWPQLIADAIDASVEIAPDPVSVSARGAWRIAARALGHDGGADRRPMRIVAPRPDRRDATARRRQLFSEATTLLRRYAGTTS